MVDKQKIERIACAFRRAIELTPKNLLPIGFAEFPLGSCGDTCLILGRHFIESGCGEFDYVLGTRGDVSRNTQCSHAWLMHEDIVVDITGDQFSDFGLRVFVGRASAFHLSFDIEDRTRADYLDYDQDTSMTLDNAHKITLGNIPHI